MAMIPGATFAARPVSAAAGRQRSRRPLDAADSSGMRPFDKLAFELEVCCSCEPSVDFSRQIGQTLTRYKARTMKRFARFREKMGFGSDKRVDQGGVDGDQVMVDFGRLVRGAVSLEELDRSHFGRSPDGTPRVVVDHVTFLALNGTGSS